jgi:hypothetical protein
MRLIYIYVCNPLRAIIINRYSHPLLLTNKAIQFHIMGISPLHLTFLQRPKPRERLIVVTYSGRITANFENVWFVLELLKTTSADTDWHD